MNNRPIGVFDSGLGGLTAFKELEKLLPNEDIIYFGDTGRVPYGTKSKETIRKYTIQIIDFLKQHNVKAILAACGTVSSVASDIGMACGIPFVDVLHSTAEAAVFVSTSKRIGIIGTPTTIASGSYEREIATLSPDIHTVAKDCPLFVPLVENGYISPQDEVTRLVAERYLTPVKNENIDTLILGCTHFPIISPIISSVMGENVKLINSGEQAACALTDLLRKNNLLKTSSSPATYQFFVSDTPDNFSSIAEIFLGHEVKGRTDQVQI
ncbi:glutamate racemase [Scatolibacter rhodanostii]|uniref:glutamate racemase n=1 Tax=Scatolibacter rhodanostii TaxID=2014781 RepID=UPI000C06DEE1|nr:glutamate racemase [Scatolibacter rhodanostii]